MLKRALISVYDKDGVFELADFLSKRNVEIVSTGGTYRYLKEKGIKVIDVSEVTGFEEILDGRVKTLNPYIHGGILAIRDNKAHMDKLKEKGITPIDMVVVNLYPFFEKVQEDISFLDKVEFIDIGGPTMLRAAAKNFRDVIVLSDKNDYANVMESIEKDSDVDVETRKYLAGKVFNLMSAYDASISRFFLGDEAYPDYYPASYKKKMDLRYGENPHQKAAYYVSTENKGPMANFVQYNGKELSYNNIRDMDVAWKAVNEFDEIACCALKHNSPCGFAIGNDVCDAYEKAFSCDSVSIFGGIVSFNRKVDAKTASKLIEIFLEIVIAPDFDDEAIEILKKKKNLRVIKCSEKPSQKQEICMVDGGLLVQDSNRGFVKDITYVTDEKPTDVEMEQLKFAMKVVKYVKSNAIVVAKNNMAIGIGGGQVNRIWAAAEALERAGETGCVLASDAFFPFSDCVEEAAKHGVTAIIQPGGSIRDKDSIAACNEKGISMVFTGMRHFKH